MTTAEIKEKRIAEDKRLADMTVGEFKVLWREMMQETLKEIQGMIWELEQQLPDPDEGLELKPEVIERIRAFEEDKNPRLISMDDLARELGLDE